MFAILAKIFGSEAVISQGLKLVDDMHTSTEEQIKAQTDQRVQIMQAYQPFKVAQRFLALMFASMYIFIMANGVVSALYGVIDMNNVEAAKDFASSMWLGEVTLTIVGFYFGGGAIEGIRAKK